MSQLNFRLIFFTVPSTDSFRQAIYLLQSIRAGWDNTGVNSLLILSVKIVLFVIFNEDPFKRERERERER